MEFDKSKVFTAFNADEVKIGSKGYFADTKEELIDNVQSEIFGFCTLKEVEITSELPFWTNASHYHYFYLVEKPKEKTKRPCTREELIEMLKKQGLPMLKSSAGNYYYTIKSIGDNNVYINENRSYESLCELYTLIDGTELWVEE